MKHLIRYSEDWSRLNETSNGMIPDSNLVTLDTPTGGKSDAKLNAKAAADFNRMVDAAKKEGIDITVYQGYRPLGDPNAGCAQGFTQWCAWKKYKSGTGNLAAKPGTSNHGWGAAIDVKNCRVGSPVHTWLKNNAIKFGFHPLASESWHWDHETSPRIVKLKGGQGAAASAIVAASTGAAAANAASGAKFTGIDNLPKVDRTEEKTTQHGPMKIGYSSKTYKRGGNIVEWAVLEPAGYSSTVILLGGLDYRDSDFSMDKQVEFLLKNLRGKRKIIGHRYTNSNAAVQSIKENPGATVVLFSAGGSYSSVIANALSDKTKLFVVEPYAADKNVVASIQAAVAAGMPRKNLMYGPATVRGAGALTADPKTGDAPTPTPQGKSHWGALEEIGTLIS